jgi:hypothetical protein
MVKLDNESYDSPIGFLTPKYLGFLKLQLVYARTHKLEPRYLNHPNSAALVGLGNSRKLPKHFKIFKAILTAVADAKDKISRTTVVNRVIKKFLCGATASSRVGCV